MRLREVYKGEERWKISPPGCDVYNADFLPSLLLLMHPELQQIKRSHQPYFSSSPAGLARFQRIVFVVTSRAFEPSCGTGYRLLSLY
ncbi:hypothetical protein PoB_002008300 [Plakobranchus ocellatus]|uniref:Uncharacterized protein n=1 Tax=Plakobranchus ocellatus TaxID=259542 RepID=A0AAV3ZGJ9_9GAST|nr:hypothetical protein PoB_002008300 [Plakobranchus ocellatus]